MANFPRGVGFVQELFSASIFCGQCAHLHVCIGVAGCCCRDRPSVCSQAPYSFSKRNPEAGANWWPGRQCQFFEFNW